MDLVLSYLSRARSRYLMLPNPRLPAATEATSAAAASAKAALRAGSSGAPERAIAAAVTEVALLSNASSASYIAVSIWDCRAVLKISSSEYCGVYGTTGVVSFFTKNVVISCANSFRLNFMFVSISAGFPPSLVNSALFTTTPRVVSTSTPSALATLPKYSPIGRR